MEVAKQAAYLGFLDDAGQQSYLSSIGQWCLKAREYYLTELNKNHDYKAFSAALISSRNAAILNVIDSGKAAKDLEDAMNFELTFE